MDIVISDKRQAGLEKYASTEYNCCQKTCLAFEEEFPLDHDELIRAAAPFGGGMGHFGLTCGALAGAGMVFANRFGGDFRDNPEYKAKFYDAVKEICEAFEARAGATTCAAFMKMQAAGIGPECRELERIGVAVAEEFIEKYKSILSDRLA